MSSMLSIANSQYRSTPFFACSSMSLDRDDVCTTFLYRFLLFLFELLVVNTWCGDFIQLLDVFVCQIAVPRHTFLRLLFHVVGPRDDVCTTFLRTRQLFCCSCRDSTLEQFPVVLTETSV